jgi:tetratricopeptide (TPR) repeat protein
MSLALVAGLLAAVGFEGARAQGADDTAALRKRIGELQNQARYSEAVVLAQQYVELALRKHGETNTEVASAIALLAILYQAQGRYAEAEPLYRRALTITEKSLGPGHRSVAVLNNLAELYHAQGRYAEAEVLYKRGLAINEKALGPTHSDVSNSLSNLALLYQDQGRYAEAEGLFKRSLAISQKLGGLKHPALVSSLNNLAVMYQAQGRYTEAEPLYRRALEINETARGLNHPEVSVSLNNLASLFRDQRRFAEAELLYKRALDITEQSLGPDDANLGATLNNLALLYRDQDRYAEAEPLLKRSLAITEKAVGPNHPAVAKSLNNLAALYWAQGRDFEAKILQTRSETISVAHGAEARLPPFPWPPPTPSAWHVIPDGMVRGSSRGKDITLDSVSRRLAEALDMATYFQRSFYATPQGFSIATQLEKINPDGSPVINNRWVGSELGSAFSLARYLERLLFAEPGRYRLVVFLVTDQPVLFSQGREIDKQQAEKLVLGGAMTLPSDLRRRAYTDGHNCFVLVYEFAKTENGKVETIVPSSLPGRVHLDRAKLWVALEKVF